MGRSILVLKESIAGKCSGATPRRLAGLIDGDGGISGKSPSTDTKT